MLFVSCLQGVAQKLQCCSPWFLVCKVAGDSSFLTGSVFLSEWEPCPGKRSPRGLKTFQCNPDLSQGSGMPILEAGAAGGGLTCVAVSDVCVSMQTCRCILFLQRG